MKFILFATRHSFIGMGPNPMTFNWLNEGSPKQSRNLNPDPSSNIILFDGVCNLCNGLVQFMIQRDPGSRFSYASLQSERGRQLLNKYGLPEDDLDTFVYIRNGKAYTKSAAVLFTMKELGGFWYVLFPLILVPKMIRDFCYDLLATYRYKIFGKKDNCMIPTPEIKSRFLD